MNFRKWPTMMRLDHFVVHIDGDQTKLETLKNTIEPMGFPFNPNAGKRTKGFQVANIWIGNILRVGLVEDERRRGLAQRVGGKILPRFAGHFRVVFDDGSAGFVGKGIAKTVH